ncbi:peptidoglycan -binding protein [Candidatus Paracaedibacter symbiosus]|uniref:peptidoglycan -binding protein n=1 Tax=Candidatus Paracaedibacter symbiosus TaxID=244582 RepID=UPI0005098CCC|nr:peptidoglycan -binding protein [Candidatus Paracaedibacter symbiosus]
MFLTPRRRRNDHLDIWPGFVDAISTLLLVIIFVLMAFVLAQFYLTDALSDKDQALSQLNKQLDQLEISLASEQTQKQLSEQEITTLREALDKFSQTFKLSEEQLAATKAELLSHQQEKTTLQEKAQTLQQQLAALEEKIKHLTASLGVETTKSSEKEAKLADLSAQLDKLIMQNTALTDENKKFKGGIGDYASEFFAKLKQAIGNRADIRVVGDRFVFQSEVLFEVASADLGEDGKKQLAPLVKTLKEITETIPQNINWILRVDGHTDNLPIHTKFPSNWELSSARAISVVKYLIAEGIPSSRLVAAGFGEFQPLEESADAKSLAKNRRIEFKLDQR